MSLYIWQQKSRWRFDLSSPTLFPFDFTVFREDDSKLKKIIIRKQTNDIWKLIKGITVISTKTLINGQINHVNIFFYLKLPRDETV